MSSQTDERRQRGLELARRHHQDFRRYLGGIWLVPSQTHGDVTHVVDATKQSCSCPDQSDDGARCEHLWAVAYVGNEITLIDGTALMRPRITADAEPNAGRCTRRSEHAAD